MAQNIIKDAPAFQGHIASPDVHVHEDTRSIRMYFHGVAKEKKGQWTTVANSDDGLNFSASTNLLGKFYFRVWHWNRHWYALAKNHNEGWGELYRSSDPFQPFETRGNFLKGMRHASVLVQGHYLLIFYSRVGDSPERILLSTVDLSDDWMTWKPSDPIDVIKPERRHEGARFPIVPSEHGPAAAVNQLRDPFIFNNNNQNILFYTIAGEEGICGCHINIEY